MRRLITASHPEQGIQTLTRSTLACPVAVEASVLCGDGVSRCVARSRCDRYRAAHLMSGQQEAVTGVQDTVTALIAVQCPGQGRADGASQRLMRR